MAETATLAAPAIRRAGEAPLDDAVTVAASRAPDRAALVHDGVVTTFAELERRVEHAAARVRSLLARAGAPTTGSAVGVTSAPHPDFAVAYFGVLRSGNVVAPLNPLLPPPALVGVLRDGDVRLALLDERAGAGLDPFRDRLPRLAAVAPLHGGPAEVGPPAPPREHDPDAPASVLFTSGTTGAPKAVLLSHRNLAVNAWQTARAHRLNRRSVAGNGLPSFHPMHLNSAVLAGATQVLCAADDPVRSVRVAAAHGVTHYYSLPVLLNRLAGHPDLPSLRAPGLRVIASGGSALAPAVAETLATHFQVPVVQGYGLAETSPLTHFDHPGAPCPGSVGRPVAGTECRVVAIGGGRELPVGEAGEVEVRGPQVMLGYLGGGGVGPDGWLATGDVGRVDAEGRLFLVDRTKDVFKHDNWLVSPTTVERALLARPEIADCCVVDRPDPLHGGAAHAVVVTAQGVSEDDLRAAVDAANAELAYYERVHSVEPAPAVPRSANGKLVRAPLRARLARGGPDATALPTVHRKNGDQQMIVLVNKFTVSGDPGEFEEVWTRSADFMRTQPGFESFRLVRSLVDPTVYVNIAHWTDAASHQQVIQRPEFRRHIDEIALLATAEPNPCTVVIECGAGS